MGAKRQELPMNGNSFGPGTSEYDLVGGVDIESFGGLSSGFMPGSILVGTSFGKMLIADEYVVRLTRELAAALVPIFIYVSGSVSVIK